MELLKSKMNNTPGLDDWLERVDEVSQQIDDIVNNKADDSKVEQFTNKLESRQKYKEASKRIAEQER